MSRREVLPNAGARRICHVISGLRTGGAERALARLLAGGLQGPFENHVISLRDRGTQAEAMEAGGARVHCLHATGAGSAPIALLRLVQLIDDLRPALVQGWMYHGNLASTLAGLLSPRRPLCWNVRQSLDDLSGDKWPTRQVIRAGRMLSARPNRIIYNSAVAAAQHERFGYSGAQSVIIPNGFEVAEVRPDPGVARRFRERQNIASGSALFAHVARFHPMKDHATFLSSANLLLDRGTEAVFVLAGNGVSAQSTGLREAVDPRHHGRFHFVGELADTLPLIQAADALVVSSRRAEGFPNVLGEAMMAGTPCITTDTGDSAAIVGDTGLIVPPADAHALAAAMGTLADNPDLARGLGRKARERIAEHYDIKAVAQRYIDLYETLLLEGSSR